MILKMQYNEYKIEKNCKKIFYIKVKISLIK